MQQVEAYARACLRSSSCVSIARTVTAKSSACERPGNNDKSTTCLDINAKALA